MKFVCSIALLSMLIFTCCSNNFLNESTLEEKNLIPANNFQDKKLQSLYTFQDRRDSRRLLSFFSDPDPKYRRAAALAFASVQNSEAVAPLERLLSDPDQTVRQAAAYALGQTGNEFSENALMAFLKIEKSPGAKQYILEALGKCGSEKGLRNLAIQNFPTCNPELLIGQAMGLYRFGLREIVSPAGIDKAVSLLHPNMPSVCRLYAAAFLARSKKVEIDRFLPALLALDMREYEASLRMQLVLAIGNSKLDEAREYLLSVMEQPVDYRIKINCIAALSQYPYETVAKSILRQLESHNTHVAVKASEYFVRFGTIEDSALYFNLAKSPGNWRVKANLLAAALKNAIVKRQISEYIQLAFQKAGNPYEKAFLLKTLGSDPEQAPFIAEQTFSARHKVVATYGMEALTELLDDCPETMREQLAQALIKAVGSSDSALVSLAASALRNPKANYKNKYNQSNIQFLNDALKRCQLPRDLEAYRELQQTINFLSGQTGAAPQLQSMNNPIDWDAVTSIHEQQLVIINTDKGTITIRLLVNESPASVSNFLRLIRKGFYKGIKFHRVVPNFVAQAGCPRGDGWGGPDFIIRSELGPLYYGEGYVGMASSGKDTEGSQWFITHSPTPHLDGRYTIFGIVESGMEVVHQLEIGDTITSYRISNPDTSKK